MKVLHSVRRRWLARTETWIYNQARYVPPEVEVHAVARVVENREQFEIERLHLLGEAPRLRRAFDDALERLRLRRYPGFLVERGRAIRPDVIHAHFGSWAWAMRHAARRIGAPLVATFYGFDVNQLPRTQPRFRRRYRDLFRDAAAVLCEGPHMRDCIIALGCPPEKAHVQHLGVEVEDIPFRARGLEPDRPLRVLMASAFREKKGLPIAFEALGRLRDEVELEISLIGDASELEASRREKARIDATIAKAGLDARVRRLGFTPHAEMLAEAATHDLFLAPSKEGSDGDTEGGAPVTVIEMAACGIPIVTTDHCDLPGIVSDGVTGIVAREDDVDSFEDALRRALALGSGWEPVTRAARRHVEREFDVEGQGRKLAAHYARVIEAHGRGRRRA